MNRSFHPCLWVALLLTAPGFSQRRKAESPPANPKIESLFKQLQSENEKDRNDADDELRERWEEAGPYFDRILAGADVIVKERIKAIAASRGKKRYSPLCLQRAKAFAKIGKFELAIEQLLAVQPPAYDVKYWQTVLDVGSLVREKAVQFYSNDFDKSVLPLETSLSDFIQNRKFPSFKWVSMEGGFGSNSDFSGCVWTPSILINEMKGMAISSKIVQFERIVDSVVLTQDALCLGNGLYGSLLIASDNHFDAMSKMRVFDSIIICRGPLPLLTDVTNSIIISSDGIGRDKRTKTSGTCIIREKEPKPFDFIKWFETAQIGVEVSLRNGEIEIVKLDAAKGFAQAGCRVGDRVGAVDNAKTETIDQFRCALRRAVIAGKTNLKVVRGKRTLEIPISVKE